MRRLCVRLLYMNNVLIFDYWAQAITLVKGTDPMLYKALKVIAKLDIYYLNINFI